MKTRAIALAVAALLATATTASAHVTVAPAEAPKGGYTKLTFRVPNERDAAGTTGLKIIFPDDVDLSMRVRPLAGWAAEVEHRGEGAVASITWTGGRIAPGEFQEFEVAGGPLPDDAETIRFLAEQTYEDGEVVRWFDPVVPGEEEPEHPAPTLALVDAEGGDAHGGGAADAGTEVDAEAASSTADDDGGPDGLAATALVAALVALLVAVAGLLRGRRR